VLSLLKLAALTAAVAGFLCGSVGFHTFRMGVTTLSFTVAHAALAGAAVGLVLGLDVSYTALAAAVVAALLLGVLLTRITFERELVSMSLFSASSALALLSIYYANTRVLATTNVAMLLWGSVLTVTPSKFLMLLAVALAFSLYCVAYRHQVDSIIYDKRMAEAEGINVALHTSALLLFSGCSIALSFMLVGGFLVFALLYNPVMSALSLVRNARAQLALSSLLGAASALSGLAISYAYDVPVGTSIALASVAVLVASSALSKLMKAIASSSSGA